MAIDDIEIKTLPNFHTQMNLEYHDEEKIAFFASCEHECCIFWLGPEGARAMREILDQWLKENHGS